MGHVDGLSRLHARQQGKGKAKRGANNPTTEQVLKCMQDLGSSALRTGALSKEDCYAVGMKFVCDPRVVKDRFDKRGLPRKKRGRPCPNISELADKYTEAAFSEIAHMVGMKPRTYRRYHGEVKLELARRARQRPMGTHGPLLKLLMQLSDSTTDSMFVSAFCFSHMEVVA
ncbi:hypothetical protein PHYSODRAFT_248810 [Phytophthora sojae]|uniref:Uncharacterized protein n=1 Tax=Phytophthora sojae (strain P6497) TaxID=1094619 RepID=G4YL94_PHYSP|nr:hypothetical protein PHYSODRAFT_248810 [Phytophthora sojae]EGZ30009.1 hypothetical protein PHYSODRAFT_248810 [Phytophthora sojae]|eukprot:XP_009517284.1 hypothetical protein PHYSODRAFT_248810 [Phytophthora sojae]